MGKLEAPEGFAKLRDLGARTRAEHREQVGFRKLAVREAHELAWVCWHLSEAAKMNMVDAFPLPLVFPSGIKEDGFASEPVDLLDKVGQCPTLTTTRCAKYGAMPSEDMRRGD